MKLLVVEDEKTLNKIISKRLESLGYEIDSCYNGVEAIQKITSNKYSGIVMDVMMPQKSGFEVLEEMQTLNITIPVLFLTARDSVSDRVQGLEMGACDYLIKPFAFDELLARVRVMLRKQNQNSAEKKEETILKIADLEMNLINHEVVRNGIQIILSAKEFALLEYFMRHPNEVLSRERIESDVWDNDYSGLTNVIDVYIRYLRKKIDDNFDKKLIQTVRGYGYMLSANHT